MAIISMLQKTVFFSSLVIGCAASFIAGKIYFSSDRPASFPAYQAQSHSGSKLAARQSRSPRNARANDYFMEARSRAAESFKFTGDPIERLASINRIDDVLERSKVILEFSQQLNASQLEALIVQLGVEGESLYFHSIHYPLLDAWVRADPQAALNHASVHISEPLARKMMISTWAEADPMEALSWARNHDDQSYKHPQLWTAAVATTIAQEDHDMATEILIHMPESYERTAALRVLLHESMKRGEGFAGEWISSIEDEELKKHVLKMFAYKQAKKN